MNGVFEWRRHLYERYVTSGQSLRRAGEDEHAANPGQRAAHVFRHCNYARALIRKYLPADKNVRILDLGCGHGVFLYFLRLEGFHNLAGVDISAEQIDLAHHLGIREARVSTIEAALAAAPDASQDVILIMDVLEHLTREELFATLSEIHRVLSPDGTCLALVPNAFGPFGMGVRYGDLTHEHAFTRKSLEQVFYSLGFDSVECYEQKPAVQGLTSLIRRGLWELFIVPHRILALAESGVFGSILTRNLVVVAAKGLSRKPLNRVFRNSGSGRV